MKKRNNSLKITLHCFLWCIILIGIFNIAGCYAWDARLSAKAVINKHHRLLSYYLKLPFAQHDDLVTMHLIELAAENQDEKCLEVLLDHGIDFYSMAHTHVNEEELIFLIKHGLDPSLPQYCEVFKKLWIDEKCSQILLDAGACDELKQVLAEKQKQREKKRAEQKNEEHNVASLEKFTWYSIGYVEFSNDDVYAALKRGDLPTLKQLIKEGKDIPAPSSKKYRDMAYPTALLWCIDQGDTEYVRLLLEAGVDPNIDDTQGMSPLALAARKEQPEFVKWLIDAGADINAVGDMEYTALHRAVHANSSDSLKILIAAGADVNVTNNFGKTPLHLATEENNGTAVKLLIDAGADVNAGDEHTTTPLYYAENDYIRTLLISAGATDFYNYAPIYKGLFWKQITNAAADYIENGIFYIFPVWFPPAAIGFFIWLLYKKLPKRARQKVLDNQLFLAIQEGDEQLARELLTAGARTTVKDKQGRTALLVAALKGQSSVLELLLKTTANKKLLFKTDIEDKYVIHYAAEGGDVECLLLLIPFFNISSISDFYGRLPLHFAAKNGQAACLRELLKIHIDNTINHQDYYGKTPLHYAAEAGHAECVAQLVAAGAKINTTDKRGETPLQLAKDDICKQSLSSSSKN